MLVQIFVNCCMYTFKTKTKLTYMYTSPLLCNTLVALACAMNVEPIDRVALTMVMVHYRAHCMKPYSVRPNVPYCIFALLGTYRL